MYTVAFETIAVYWRIYGRLSLLHVLNEALAFQNSITCNRMWQDCVEMVAYSVSDMNSVTLKHLKLSTFRDHPRDRR